MPIITVKIATREKETGKVHVDEVHAGAYSYGGKNQEDRYVSNQIQ